MAEITKKDYKRAEKFLAWKALFLVSNPMVKPNWINNSDKFWYIREFKEGFEFLIFNPRNNTFEAAFDHEKVANSLSTQFNRKISAKSLPFNSITILEDQTKFIFSSIGKEWICDLELYQISEFKEEFVSKPTELLSPNRKWALFHKDFNLYVRSIKSNQVIPLTSDGEKHYEYAITPECSTHEIVDRRMKKPKKPVAVWSPDSSKIVTFKIDQRKVKDIYLLQSVPEDDTHRPILHSY